jgi:hypothetical protein
MEIYLKKWLLYIVISKVGITVNGTETGEILVLDNEVPSGIFI